MPDGKRKKKKIAPRKPVKKSVKKKTAGKKPAKIKAAKKKTVKKKTGAKKKPIKKITVRKKAAVKTERGLKQATSPKPFMIEAGPPPGNIPPVEEPARYEEATGIVTHYYSHLSVAVVQINYGTLKTGDAIHITGHVTDLTQKIESMEYEHRHVDQASAGQCVGLMVKDHVREHDIVYLVK